MNATSICLIPNKEKSLKISDFELMVHVTSLKEPSLGIDQFLDATYTTPSLRAGGGTNEVLFSLVVFGLCGRGFFNFVSQEKSSGNSQEMDLWLYVV